MGLFRARYQARFARNDSDVTRALCLRALCFRGDANAQDADAFDAACLHVLVIDTRAGDELVCTFRILPFESGAQVATSYAAQFYELSALRDYRGRLVEMGRFCVAPGQSNPDILRCAWRAMTDYVGENGVEMLFGCSSFKGVNVVPHLDAFALLAAHHLAPKRWLPRVKAPRVFRFGRRLRLKSLDRTAALRAMPPLLRTYLVMGGWVSDHAVVDADLDTMHVFTGLEVQAIPETRKRLLRA